jgi:hypothetical protein
MAMKGQTDFQAFAGGIRVFDAQHSSKEQGRAEEGFVRKRERCQGS